MTTSLFTVPQRREIRLDGAAPLVVIDHWLDAAEADLLFAEVMASAPWFRPKLWIYGEEHLAPRSTAWFGDPGAVYRYSGTVNTPAPWLSSLRTVRSRIEETAGATFNSCLANLYRDGEDHVNWHADDEGGLGHDPVIASLSLGATRRFVLRKRDARNVKIEILLEHGQLVVMGSGTQRTWQHAVPKMVGVKTPRVNLTWRLVRGAGAASTSVDRGAALAR